MGSLGITGSIVMFLLAIVFGLFGAFAVLKPRLAFELAHILQLKDSELTDFGVATTKIGGAGFLLLGGGIVLTTLHYVFWLLFTLIVAVPFVIAHPKFPRLIPPEPDR